MRDGGLAPLPSSALTGVDRPLAFSTYFPFISRLYLHLFGPEPYSETPSAKQGIADGRMRAKTKRLYYTERRGN